jgi:hypothetical protein
MTISSREKEVPTRLPAARLYLDDIEEIREIILDAAVSRALKPEIDPTQHTVHTKFYIGDQVCTEIQDLPKVKKLTRDFEMRLSALDGFRARFGVDQYATQWTTDGLTKADAWRAFHKLETVFDRRKIRWRNLLPRAAGSLALLLVNCVLVALWLVASRVGRVIYALAPSHPELASFLFTLATIALIAPAAFFLMRHSTVILRYSWDQATQREDRNTKILIAAVSAMIAFVLGVASIALKHKYWP